MKFLAVLINLAVFVAGGLNDIRKDSMVSLDTGLAEDLPASEISLDYDELDEFDPISARLVAVLENLRDVFANGTETIPPLDPIRLASIGPIQFRSTGGITGTLNAQDVQVNGLKQFIVKNMSFSFIGLMLSFEMAVPKIDFRAQYQVDSHVAFFIPYHPSGDARISVDDVKVNGFASLGENPEGFLTLSDFKLNLGFDDFVADIEGMTGGHFINTTFNRLLNLLGPGFLKGKIEHISELITDEIHDAVNEFIGQYHLSDLMD